MTGAADLRDEIRALLRERLHVEVTDDDTDLLETGTIDSLMFVELLASIEETYGITVPIDDLDVDEFRSVSRLAAFVARRRTGAPSS